jgi:signal transduction histidine kinase
MDQDSNLTRNLTAADPIIHWINALQTGQYEQIIQLADDDSLSPEHIELIALARIIEKNEIQQRYFSNLTSQINTGIFLEEILEILYTDFKSLIPYNRIGFALIDEKEYSVKAHWAKSDQPKVYIKKGYKASLNGSSLENILITAQPRIINDLAAYLEQKPNSDSTRLIVAEGMRSSLTCPLITNGRRIGFLFFSSILQGAYSPAHIQVFQQIANQIAIVVEKGRLVSELAFHKSETEVINEELRRLNKLKNDFLAIAAHDLRNPMSYIQLGASLLLETDADLSTGDSLQIIQGIYKNAEFINTLLNDLLDIAMFDTGSFSLNPTSISIEKFLQEAIAFQTELAGRKKIQIILEPIKEGQVLADPLRLRQVLDNLISNAVKFSPIGSKIWVRAKRMGGGWRIEVQDQGPGFSHEDRIRLFKEFSQLSAKPTGGERSTGLGLAISFRIVEAHGGDIGVDTTEGSGSTFWFALPDISGSTLNHAVRTAVPINPQTSESS